MFCPKCQTENPEGSKFCTSCGAPLVVSSTEQPVSQPTVPPSPEPPKSNKKTFIIIGIIVFLFLFVGGLFFVGRRIKQGLPKSQVPSYQRTTPTITPLPKRKETLPSAEQIPPAQKPIIQTVGTEFVGVNANLTEVKRSGNVVTVHFTLQASDVYHKMSASGTKIIGKDCKEKGKDYPDCAAWEIGQYDEPYSVSSAFIVDETDQMKYEVLKDASGNYLASKDVAQMLKARQAISLYAQFTAPPETTQSITINFPKVQPFTGISLE